MVPRQIDLLRIRIAERLVRVRDFIDPACSVIDAERTIDPFADQYAVNITRHKRRYVPFLRKLAKSTVRRNRTEVGNAVAFAVRIAEDQTRTRARTGNHHRTQVHRFQVFPTSNCLCFLHKFYRNYGFFS